EKRHPFGELGGQKKIRLLRRRAPLRSLQFHCFYPSAIAANVLQKRILYDAIDPGPEQLGLPEMARLTKHCEHHFLRQIFGKFLSAASHPVPCDQAWGHGSEQIAECLLAGVQDKALDRFQLALSQSLPRAS